MKDREIVKLIEQDGWYWKRASGSHQIYKHRTKPGMVVVAYPRAGHPAELISVAA